MVICARLHNPNPEIWHYLHHNNLSTPLTWCCSHPQPQSHSIPDLNHTKKPNFFKEVGFLNILDRNKIEFQAMASVGLEPTRFRG